MTAWEGIVGKVVRQQFSVQADRFGNFAELSPTLLPKMRISYRVLSLLTDISRFRPMAGGCGAAAGTPG